jgi:hypothetical protein
MKELFERITVWHEKNLPAGLPYEPLPQIGFLLEELHEVNKEFIKGDIDAAVGEITDLIVFSVNALVLLGCDNIIAVNSDVNFIDKNKVNIISVLMFAVERIAERAAFDVIHSKIDCVEKKQVKHRYVDLIEESINCVASLGYSPEIALEETVRKIESRRGAWDSSIGKWVKEKNQTDVYIPDYSLARLS